MNLGDDEEWVGLPDSVEEADEEDEPEEVEGEEGGHALVGECGAEDGVRLLVVVGAGGEGVDVAGDGDDVVDELDGRHDYGHRDDRHPPAADVAVRRSVLCLHRASHNIAETR